MWWYMALWRNCLAWLLLLSTTLEYGNAFYLPGVTPRDFQKVLEQTSSVHRVNLLSDGDRERL